MVAGTEGSGEGEIGDSGIVAGHAYSLITAKELELSDGSSVKLLKLRNPWADGHEWTGDWCDDDVNWTHHLREDMDIS
jgi:calpain